LTTLQTKYPCPLFQDGRGSKGRSRHSSRRFNVPDLHKEALDFGKKLQAEVLLAERFRPTPEA
jgi:hypothetical protein